jgi:putative ABC transport system permease protein
MDTLIQDVRFGLRMLAKAPGFTLVAVLTIALGIGANTTVFSLANAALLKPLPFPHAERLMMMFHSYPDIQLPRSSISPESWDYYLKNVHSLEAMSAYAGFRAPQNLTSGGNPERVQTVLATYQYFDVLGVRPLHGRTFVASDDTPAAGRVAVLGYGLWKTRFGGSQDILGKDISLDGKNFTVIGIMPSGFEFPQKAQLWVPAAFTPEQLKDGVEFLNVIGRIRQGLTTDAVVAEMTKTTAEVRRLNPGPDANKWSVIAEPLRDVVVGKFRNAILVLLAAVMLVLLIGCANIANLLLARATARNKELSIRSALGASRMRVIRQLLTEGVLLAMCGGVLGLILSIWGVDLLLSIVPVELPSFVRIGLDVRVLLFTFATSIFAGLLFGSVPAFQVSLSALNETLKEGGRTSMTSGRHASRRILVISEVALAMVLLISAGLMIRSFARILQSNPGFNAQGAITANVMLPKTKYNDKVRIAAFYRELTDRIASLPGVTVAGASSSLPLETNWMNSFYIQGRMDIAPRPHAHAAVIASDYFKALQVPLVSGRFITSSDTATGTPIAIIDENARRAYWPNEDPIGKQIALTSEGTDQNPLWRTIVGVVGSVKHDSVVVNETKGQVFLPHAQFPDPWMKIVVRTNQDPGAVAAAIRNQVMALDPEQPIFQVRSMQSLLDESVAQPRFNTLLLTLFASLALVLAAIGIYGVMSYAVTQRTHEIGVRMALGAQQNDVLRMIVANAMWLAVIGLVAGLVGSLIATRLLSGLLFEVNPTDPLTFLVITAILGLIALLAGFIPARRATRVDPIVALRYE